MLEVHTKDCVAHFNMKPSVKFGRWGSEEELIWSKNKVLPHSLYITLCCQIIAVLSVRFKNRNIFCIIISFDREIINKLVFSWMNASLKVLISLYLSCVCWCSYTLHVSLNGTKLFGIHSNRCLNENHERKIRFFDILFIVVHLFSFFSSYSLSDQNKVLHDILHLCLLLFCGGVLFYSGTKVRLFWIIPN